MRYIALYQWDVENRDSIVGFANRPLWEKLWEQTKGRIYKVLFVRMSESEICFLEDLWKEDRKQLARHIYNKISDPTADTLVMN